jgi:hypothetical protein
MIDAGVLLSVLPPLLAVGFTVGGVLAYRRAGGAARRLQRSFRAQGVVLAVEYNASRQVFPTVRFSTADGRTTQAKPDSSASGVRFQVGQQVGLRYDPDDPRWMVLDGLPTMTVGGKLVGVGLVLVGVVMAVLTVLTR